MKPVRSIAEARKVLTWPARRWFILAWTGTIAYLVFDVNSSPDDFGLNGAVICFLVFIVWPFGLVVIMLAALAVHELVRWIREAPERRRYWAELKARDAGRRRDPPSFFWRGPKDDKVV